ncbi:MAG: site-2 protease family protein [Nanoarchaeota archaeon]
MSFFVYDLIFLIVFCSVLVLFLLKRRKKLQREGILILYRTKLGIKIINYIGNRYRKFLNAIGYLVIFVGYALMISMLALLFQLVYLFWKFPEFIRAVKIPPIMPLIPYIPEIFKVDFLPPFYFTYWIIVLVIAAVSHEFCHGIFARAKKVKIKSTGFAFLGPFTGAFVEPDENKVKKLGIKSQLSFLSAGTFANLTVALLFFIVMWLFFASAFTASGVVFNTYTFSVINRTDIQPSGETLFINFNDGLNLTKVSVGEETYYVENKDLESKQDYVIAYEDTPALRAGLSGVITEIDGERINNNLELKQVLEKKSPGDEVIIKTLFNDSVREYKLALTERNDNKSQAYLGIALIRSDGLSILSRIRSRLLFFKDPNTYYKPKVADEFFIFIYNLLWWIVLVNFSVGLVNMLPVGIFDGGRVFFLTILGLTKSEKAARWAYKFSTYLLISIFLLLTLLWFVRIGWFG